MRGNVLPPAAGFCSCSASADVEGSRYVRQHDDECGGPCAGEEELSPVRRCGGAWLNAVYRSIAATSALGSAGVDCYAECRVQLGQLRFAFTMNAGGNAVEWAWDKLMPALQVDTHMARVLHEYIRGVHAELLQLTPTLGVPEAVRVPLARMARRFALIGSTCGDAPGDAGSMYTAVLRARAWARVGYTPLIVLVGAQWDDAAVGGRLRHTACGEVLAVIEASGVEVVRVRDLPRAFGFPALLHAGALVRAGRLNDEDFVMVAPPRVLPLSVDHFDGARDWSKRAHLYDSLCADCFPCSVKDSKNCTVDAYRAESVYVGIQAPPSRHGCATRRPLGRGGIRRHAVPRDAGGGAERDHAPLGCGRRDRQRGARAVHLWEHAAGAVRCDGLLTSDGDEVNLPLPSLLIHARMQTCTGTHM